MPARDTYHDAVRNALVKDGWTITDDPFRLVVGSDDAYVDLAAERMIAAERGTEKIAVEVKSFVAAAEMREFELAVGQYAFYRAILEEDEPERKLYLAIPDSTLLSTFNRQITRPVLEKLALSAFSFDPDEERIVTWKTWTTTERSSKP